jgi:protein-S-isoprenylcysteine O-methyltransferase Ste14
MAKNGTNKQRTNKEPVISLLEQTNMEETMEDTFTTTYNEDEKKIEEYITAYYYSKTGQMPTKEELQELLLEIDDETRTKVMALHIESEEAKLKQHTHNKFAQHYEKSTSKTWNQAWLIFSGLCIGLLSTYAGQMPDQDRSQVFHINRGSVDAGGRPYNNDFQQASMYFLVAIGVLLAFRRYYYLTVDPLHPTTKVEKRMAICLFVNVMFLCRFWLMVSNVKRSVPWWETIVTGGGMAVLQPLLMGLCALPIYQQKKTAKDRSGTAVLLVDMFCCGVALFGIFVSSYSEYQRATFVQLHPQTLYTGGLFRYARHINYMGEVLLFVGWCVLTRSRYALIVPFFFFTTFKALYIPDLEVHLQGKYNDDYNRWVVATPFVLIPFVV